MAAPISTTYTPEQRKEIGEKVCSLVVEMGVKAACAEAGISSDTFFRWLVADAELSGQYARAREAVGYKDELEIADLAEEARREEMRPDVARVVIDTRKWLAGKRNPKVYGEKMQTENKNDNKVSGMIVVASEREKEMLEDI